MIGYEGKEHGFDRLFEAAEYFPEKVPHMIHVEPELLSCTNYAGETVLQFFSMEGKDSIVKLLLSCGAIAEEWALYYACGPAHVGVISLLLSAGAEPDCDSCSKELLRWEVPRNKKIEIKRIFHNHGYEIKI
ncbi:MAG: ankyrin repeat domain-containing protein [Cellvibrionaceae bacterium]